MEVLLPGFGPSTVEVNAGLSFTVPHGIVYETCGKRLVENVQKQIDELHANVKVRGLTRVRVQKPVTINRVNYTVSANVSVVGSQWIVGWSGCRADTGVHATQAARDKLYDNVEATKAVIAFVQEHLDTLVQQEIDQFLAKVRQTMTVVKQNADLVLSTFPEKPTA